MKRKLKSFLREWLPASVRAHRILAGPLRGHSIATSWHDYPAAITGRTERPLLDWFAKNVMPGETWLDIGAHYGYTAIALCRLVGASGRVFAFEPMLSTAGYLTETRRLNGFAQLTVLPFGLAAAETLGSKCLPVTRGMVDSTLGKDQACPERIRRSGRARAQAGEWQETITVARLDWLWPRICGDKERIDGVKVDVQGMEIEVLRGMVQALRQHKPRLAIEVHHGVNRAELLDLVEAAGYSRHAIPVEPVEGEVEPRYLDDRSYAFPALS